MNILWLQASPLREGAGHRPGRWRDCGCEQELSGLHSRQDDLELGGETILPTIKGEVLGDKAYAGAKG